MDEMMSQGTSDQMGRVTEAFLKMKKFDIAELKRAYEGE
jgi:predicted 3-demethylubiquinone-9 3-methyltransferase (glyoxalase superfamily)